MLVPYRSNRRMWINSLSLNTFPITYTSFPRSILHLSIACTTDDSSSFISSWVELGTSICWLSCPWVVVSTKNEKRRLWRITNTCNYRFLSSGRTRLPNPSTTDSRWYWQRNGFWEIFAQYFWIGHTSPDLATIAGFFGDLCWIYPLSLRHDTTCPARPTRQGARDRTISVSNTLDSRTGSWRLMNLDRV